MTLSYRQENAKTPAALLGIDEEEAAQHLSLRIAVSFDSEADAARELGSGADNHEKATPSKLINRVRSIKSCD